MDPLLRPDIKLHPAIRLHANGRILCDGRGKCEGASYVKVKDYMRCVSSDDEYQVHCVINKKIGIIIYA